MSKYKINYRLTIDSGDLIDEAQNFEFVTGDGQLALELEKIITTSKVNHLQTILLQGSDIFGEYDSQGITEVSIDELPKDLKLGSAIDFDLPNGEKVVGVVKDIVKKVATIDFNHPLSQFNIAFNFEILSKKE